MKQLITLLVFLNLQFPAFAQTQMAKPTAAQNEESIREIEKSQNESCKAVAPILREMQSGKYDKLTPEEVQKVLPMELMISCGNSIMMEAINKNLRERKIINGEIKMPNSLSTSSK